MQFTTYQVVNSSLQHRNLQICWYLLACDLMKQSANASGDTRVIRTARAIVFEHGYVHSR